MRVRIGAGLVLLIGILLAATPHGQQGQDLARDQTIGALEVVATFDGPMPTGVGVSDDGRIFTNFPRWGDDVQYTVAEVKNGRTVPYPNAEINRADPARAADTLLAVQSVVVDPTGKRLWLLDTGNGFGPLRLGGPKLVGVDLATNAVVKKIVLPLDVAVEGTYLNDVRFDLRRGKEGLAFITDSGATGIITIDLATGRSWRRLQNHPSTKPEPQYMAVVEGQILLRRGQRFQVGSDGIAISPDGKWLYYSVLTGRRLFRVSVDALADPQKSDAEVAATVEDFGEKGGSADGLESDAEGRIYLTDFEHNSIHRRKADGGLETLVHDPRLLWPDSLSLAADGYLYITANQINRQANFQGTDKRKKPYVLFRLKVDGTRQSHKALPSGSVAATTTTPRVREAYADLPGVRLWYRDSGGSGAPLVLLHAATGSADSWEHQVPAFAAAGYRVIAYDRRGFGRTTIDPAGPQPGTGADDLHALADHLGIDRFHLVSTAAGGFVALDYAASFQSRLRSLVVANSMGLIQDEEFLEVGRRIRPPEFAALPSDYKELSPSYRAANPQGTQRWIAIERANHPEGVKPVMQRVRNRMTFALLQTLTVPTLLMAGEADPYMPPPVMRMIASRIKHADTIVVPETSHAAFWEQPELFNRHVLAFVAKH